jgi:hypothetical protein
LVPPDSRLREGPVDIAVAFARSMRVGWIRRMAR